MSEINLIQTESSDTVSLAPKEGKKIGLFVLIFLLALELLAYGFFVFQEKQSVQKIQGIEQKLTEIDQEIAKTDTERLRAISFQSRVMNLDVLLDAHVFWSKAFEELEKFTYIPATINGVQADELSGTLIVSGAIPSYTDLARMMLGLEQSENVSEAKLLSSSLATDGGNSYVFSLEIVFDPNLLIKN